MKRVGVYLAAVASLILAGGCSSPSGPQGNTTAQIVDMAHVGTVQTDGGTLILAHFKGSYYDMGYQEGYLLGDKIIDLWNTFMVSINQQMGLDESSALSILTGLYGNYQPYIPREYNDEIRGVVDGAVAAGFLTDDTTERTYLQDVLNSIIVITDYFSCSFFAAWGPRTVDGKMFSSRDLDWNSDTGIASYKMLAVYDPDGQIPYMIATYTGLLGALNGMNMSGITVSEIGSHNADTTYQGEPWSLRMRDILSTAGSLAQVKTILWDFKDRPNTGGYNWMFSYGDPSGNGANAGAYSVESDSMTTSVFGDDSDIERDAVWIDNEGNPVTSAVLKRPETDPSSSASPMPVEFCYEKPASCLTDTMCYFFTDTQTGLPAGRTFTAASPFTYDVTADTSPLHPSYTVNNGLAPGIHYGLPMTYAVFKNDVALTPSVRQTQTATSGPGNTGFNLSACGGDDGDPIQDVNRYWAMYWLITTYETGGTYINNRDTWKVLDNVPPTKIGLEQAATIASAVAMSGDIISIAYAPTDLDIAVAYESGKGPTWRPASSNTYYVFSLRALLANDFTPMTTYKPWPK
ncbi:MAG: C45 family autoproteolytic acyltransferase/hydrolase [Deltaproteobacteria bacterium]|nr:C45 family autoproteolytic acyltransferase/hydrolase [Deltaproteobacteria bacterium]MCL5277422.1 C45 family autoproteolytic acyltransferase/hydrolase [Deltaproteobacteria bacterium]